MLNKNEKEERDYYRKKYYKGSEILNYISMRKLVIKHGITWGSWYRFVFYGENCVSLKKVKEVDKGVMEELRKIKQEIEDFMEEK